MLLESQVTDVADGQTLSLGAGLLPLTSLEQNSVFSYTEIRLQVPGLKVLLRSHIKNIILEHGQCAEASSMSVCTGKRAGETTQEGFLSSISRGNGFPVEQPRVSIYCENSESCSPFPSKIKHRHLVEMQTECSRGSITTTL